MSTSNESATKLNVYSIVTNRIIELLEQGTIPWQKPWIESGIPMNLLSKRPYRGINLWLLLALNYQRNLFLTWDQLKKLGGSVKQGEHGHIVIYYTSVVKTDAPEEESERKKSVLKYYKVFNIEQCRDIPGNLIEPLEQKEFTPLQQCDAIVEGMPTPPAFQQKEQKAYYDVENDLINMPKRKSFKTMDSYNSTLFHELVHCTGHVKRLNRATITEMAEFGSKPYSIEELVAELGAAYLCSHTGILTEQIKNTAAYIQGWLGKLKNDKGFIIRASGQAQRAVDYILNIKENFSGKELEQTELLSEE